VTNGGEDPAFPATCALEDGVSEDFVTMSLRGRRNSALWRLHARHAAPQRTCHLFCTVISVADVMAVETCWRIPAGMGRTIRGEAWRDMCCLGRAAGGLWWMLRYIYSVTLSGNAGVRGGRVSTLSSSSG